MAIEVAAILSGIPWSALAEQVAATAVAEGARSLLSRLAPAEREMAVNKSVELFAEEFVRELTDASPITAAIPGYRDQLKTLIESAAPFIAVHLQPEVRDVDLGPVQRQWTGDPLPEDFSWQRLALNFERALRKLVRTDATLRDQLSVALQERAAGPAPGFDLPAYRDFLHGKCGALQLSAMHKSGYDLRFTLWNVFVPPSARESAAVRELPRALRQRLRLEGHLRGDAAEDEELERHEFEELRQRWESGAVTPVLDLLERERFLVILGDPGSGKSSLLKFRALQWANGGEDDATPLPLWVDLRDFAASRKTLLEYLHNAPGGFRLDFRDIETRLQDGKAAFYLDGLDEVFDPDQRHRVVEEIAALAAQYRSARAVVTSRIIGYEPDRLRDAGFAHATLEDFDEEQRQIFLEKWHSVAESEASERNRLRQQLSAALRDSPAIRDLAGNPLLLTMMALLNRNQDLPRDRVELYREASRVLLQEWETRKAIPVETFGRQEKESLLRRLAGEMQQGDSGLAGNLISRGRLTALIQEYLKELGVSDVYARAKELVRQLEERNFILCYGGADSFSFVHRTFLEFFCAAWFVDQIQVQQTLSIGSLKTDVFGRHWRDESWHEVLRLITGMLGASHSRDLIRFLMEQDGSEDELRNLLLAGGCLSEVRNRVALSETDAALKKRFLTEVVRYDWPYVYPESAKWEFVGGTRSSAVRLLASTWRNQETCAWLKEVAQDDPDSIVRQSAIQELARGWKCDPDTMPLLRDRAVFDEDHSVRQAAIRELARGWKANPETLPWLNSMARSGEDWAIRIAAVREIARGWKAEPETLTIVKDIAYSDGDGLVRGEAVQELARGWKNDPWTLPWLNSVARSDEDPARRRAAVHELASGFRNIPETLPLLKDRARSDQDGSVRCVALAGLARGFKSDPETLPLLKDLARSDAEMRVRLSTLIELAHGWKSDPETLTLLKVIALSDESEFVRRAAVQAFVRASKSHPGTLAWLKDQAGFAGSWLVQETAVMTVAQWWKLDPETLPWLKDQARSDKNSEVRRAAVQELARGWKSDPETLPLLQDRARSDGNEYVRREAVYGLACGFMTDPETMALLKDRARSDGSEHVRWAAVRMLGRGFKADPETLPLLKDRARSDPDDDVRRAALQELARKFKADTETLPLLKDRARSDENWDVRQAAVQELVRGFKADPETLPLLRACIASAPPDTRSWRLDQLKNLLRSRWPDEAA